MQYKSQMGLSSWVGVWPVRLGGGMAVGCWGNVQQTSRIPPWGSCGNCRNLQNHQKPLFAFANEATFISGASSSLQLNPMTKIMPWEPTSLVSCISMVTYSANSAHCVACSCSVVTSLTDQFDAFPSSVDMRWACTTESTNKKYGHTAQYKILSYLKVGSVVGLRLRREQM